VPHRTGAVVLVEPHAPPRPRNAPTDGKLYISLRRIIVVGVGTVGPMQAVYYLPSALATAIQAWADPHGSVLDPLIDGAPRWLRRGGELVVVQPAIAGVAETVARMEAAGLVVEILLRETGPARPVTRRAAANGLLGPEWAPGRTDEEIVVICGRRPGRRRP
jgi:hypothetical protein